MDWDTTPFALTQIADFTGDNKSRLQQIGNEMVRYNKWLASDFQDGTGTNEVYDFTDSVLWIYMIILSAASDTANTGGTAQVMYDIDGGGIEYLARVEVNDTAGTTLVLPFNRPIEITAAGDIDHGVSGATIHSTAIIYGEVEV